MAHARGDQLRLDLAAHTLISRTKFHRKTKETTTASQTKQKELERSKKSVKWSMQCMQSRCCSVPCYNSKKSTRCATIKVKKNNLKLSDLKGSFCLRYVKIVAFSSNWIIEVKHLNLKLTHLRLQRGFPIHRVLLPLLQALPPTVYEIDW